ncbi:MAG: hypothetical protein ACP5I4_14385, partial [Oceanipulchritudo sp.]
LLLRGAVKSAETGPSGSLDDWETILEEAESGAEFAADPLADLEEELDFLATEPSDFLFSASIAVGPGYSSNYLKRPEPVGSRFLQVEADVWLNWLGEASSITALAFFEGQAYGEKNGVSNEYLAFAQANWTFSRENHDFGLEAELFQGDQVYDASLITAGAPVGERLRQFRPETGLFVDWYFSRRDRLRGAVSVLRVEYDLEAEDYWEPMLTSEWERRWTASIKTASRMELSRQLYDDKPGRTAWGGDQQTEENLRVNRLGLEEQFRYEPGQWKWLRLHLNLGLAWEEDRTGEYESLRQSWASLGLRFVWDRTQFRASGRWMEIRYRDRQLGLTDPTLQLQTQRNLKIELKKKLPWNLALSLRGEWTRFDSRLGTEAYSERRSEALLGWSY